MTVYTGKEHLNKANMLLYFYANFMPEHKRMMKIINNLKEDGYSIFVIDVGSFKEMIPGYDITCVPTFLFIKDKKIHSKIEGLQMSSVINNAVYTIFNKGN